MHMIYVIEHVESGRTYVGRTGFGSGRVRRHFANPSKLTAIGRAVLAHGRNAFHTTFVDSAHTKQEAILRERFHIHLRESNDPRFGFNSPRLLCAKS
jgi:hypothetical protein